MKLFSERLMYRPWTYEDDESIEEILGDEFVCRFLPGNNKKSKEEINKWLQFFVRSFNDELGNKIFLISCKDTLDVIGYGGIGYVKEFDAIEIMYGFKKSAWGKGYATEASVRFKELAIESGLQKVIALADVDNVGSQKVLRKTGFQEIKKLSIWGMDALYYEMNL